VLNLSRRLKVLAKTFHLEDNDLKFGFKKTIVREFFFKYGTRILSIFENLLE